MWKRLVLPARWWSIEYKKAACSVRMFERSCLWQRRLFTFVRHYASHEVSSGMLTKVCRARINYLKLLCFLHYLLTVWRHIFIGCSQGGNVTFGNTWCTVKRICRSNLFISHQKYLTGKLPLHSVQFVQFQSMWRLPVKYSWRSRRGIGDKILIDLSRDTWS